MVSRLATIGSACALATMMAAGDAAAEGCSRTSTGGIIGALGGAAAGGLLGSQIGSGTGNKVAIGVGVLAGGVLGNELGRNMDCASQEKAIANHQRTLETQPAGSTSNWQNPDAGYSGSTTPTRTWTNDRGEPCRDYVTTVSHEGQTEQIEGTACRRDGKWVTM